MPTGKKILAKHGEILMNTFLFNVYFADFWEKVIWIAILQQPDFSFTMLEMCYAVIYCMDDKKADNGILISLLDSVCDCHFNLKIGIHIWNSLKYFHFYFLANPNQKICFRSSVSYF